MKALDRNVETLGLWIVTSSVAFIKSVNQSSIKPCLTPRISDFHKIFFHDSCNHRISTFDVRLLTRLLRRGVYEVIIKSVNQSSIKPCLTPRISDFHKIFFHDSCNHRISTFDVRLLTRLLRRGVYEVAD